MSDELPEIPCCPVHERLLKLGQLRPLDNCFVCIRNERDSLHIQLAASIDEQNRLIDSREALRKRLAAIQAHCVAITASDPKLSAATRDSVNRIGELAAATTPAPHPDPQAEEAIDETE